MADYLLLRFRDLPRSEQRRIKTIIEHNEIVDNRGGRVIWGWWKKPLELTPDPGLSLLKNELHPGEYRALLVDSADGRLYHAPLYVIYYEPGAPPLECPNKAICPTYYNSEKLPAWFEIGRIREGLPEGFASLDEFVWSHRNRTEPRRSAAALPEYAINQVVTDIEFLDSNVSLWFIIPTQDVGLRDRGDLVQATSRGVWHSKGHYALHLSDLHFGEHHAFRNQLSRGLEVARESLLEALLQDLETIEIKDRDIALVLVTGDLTWAGESHEFANAENFFDVLCRKVGLHRSQVIIVPGNHDIEWREGKEEIDENAEYNYLNFISNFYGVAPGKSLLRIHQFMICGRPVRIIGLNTCRLESKQNAGIGFVGREQIKEFQNFLHTFPIQENELRIALGHHHLVPVNYVEFIDWTNRRVSIMLDADAVLRNLMYSNTRLILHGHQHQPFMAEVRRIIDKFIDPFGGNEMRLDRTALIVGGGSVGVERSHLNVVGRNSYNIIDMAFEDNPSKFEVRTRIQSPDSPAFSDYQRVVFPISL